MFWAIVVAVFAVCIRMVRDEVKPVVFKQRDPVIRQYKYQYQAQKKEIRDEYDKTKLPKSGYMLTEEYEKLSKGIPRSSLIIDEAAKIKPSDMKYVPQPTYKLVRYNNPPGSPELNIPRKMNFNRQVNAQGIISSDFTKLVYPTVYYYADANCTSCAVFVIPLDTKLTKIDRVKRANVAKKIDKPIFETSDDLSTEGAFRTITPVDFSEDNRYIIAKEKIGYVRDGIWKTNLWIHDFQTDSTWELPEIRAAIINYWHNRTGVDLAENRWDIYPLGFDKQNQGRVLVCGYAYTGAMPAFLGTWSVDITGERCELVDLEGTKYNVSVVGFKLAYDSYETRDFIEWEGDRQTKLEKSRKKEYRKQRKAAKKQHKKVYKKRLKQLKAEYRLKLKEYKKMRKTGVTSAGDDIKNIDPETVEKSQDVDYEKVKKEREEMVRKQQAELELKRQKHNKSKEKSKKENKDKTTTSDKSQTTQSTEQQATSGEQTQSGEQQKTEQQTTSGEQTQSGEQSKTEQQTTSGEQTQSGEQPKTEQQTTSGEQTQSGEQPKTEQQTTSGEQTQSGEQPKTEQTKTNANK